MDILPQALFRLRPESSLLPLKSVSASPLLNVHHVQINNSGDSSLFKDVYPSLVSQRPLSLSIPSPFYDHMNLLMWQKSGKLVVKEWWGLAATAAFPFTCSQFQEIKPIGTRCVLEYLYWLHIAYYSFTSFHFKAIQESQYGLEVVFS